MADKIKIEKINGAKFRSFPLPDGTYSDPFQEYDFWSRTILPEGTVYLEAQEVDEMIFKIKDRVGIEFSEDNLSESTKQTFKDKGIETKEEKEKVK